MLTVDRCWSMLFITSFKMTENIVGKCLLMCPPIETEMRQKERLLHPLEILAGTESNRCPKADPNKVVKKYSRSAAGLNLCDAKSLRPPSVLLKTIKYLLNNVTKDDRFSDICIYNFINDRLRAVKQDMIVQSLKPQDCINILEPIVKFHIIYGYKLCELSINDYDPVLNNNHLNECLKLLLSNYDEIDKELKSSNTINIDLKNVFANRSLFETIYILHNLGNHSALTRYINLSLKYKNGFSKMAYEISISYINRNWIRLIKLAQNLPAIELCAISIHIPLVQRQALHVMSHAYNNKMLTYPMQVLKENLLYKDTKEIANDCKYYGIELVENSIQFSKTSFDNNKKVINARHIEVITNKLHKESISLLCLNK